MRVRRLSITDFNTIGEAEIDFDALPSLVMIAGRVRSAGASSNGAGKSSILDALTWGLFGEELRDRAKGKVVRKGQPSCHVKVVLGLDSGKDMTVERHRKRSGATEVVLDGKRVSTASGGQEEVERRLGFNYDLFTRTVVFGGSLSAFCRLQPAERTRLLEELLGINYYLEASDAAKERLREVEERVQRFHEKHEARRQRRVELRNDMIGGFTDAGGRDLKVHRELSRLTGEAAQLVLRIEALSFRLGQANLAAGEEREKHKQAVKEWRSKVDEAQKYLQQSVEVRGRLQATLATAQSELAAAKRELKMMQDRDVTRVCPACKRPFDGGKGKPPDLTPFTERIVELSKIVDKRQEAVAKAEGEVKVRQKLVRDLQEHEPQPPKQTSDAQTYLTKLHEAEGELAAVQRRIEEVEADDSADEPLAAAIRAWNKLRELREKGDKDEEQRAALEREADMLRFWQSGMGRDGIPSMLLEATAPALNKAIKPLADILTDGAYTFKFGLHQRGQRSDFRVDVSNVEGGDSYDDLSKGELTRVDLCVLFAIRQLMMDRAAIKFDQVFIDELLDGLDETGMEYAARLLRSQRLAKQTVYISHADALKDAADGVITVVKKGGVSRIKT